MRWIIAIGFYVSSVALLAQQIAEVREQFHTINNEERLMAFIKLTTEVNDSKATPYIEAANMQMARYTANPIKKLKYFNEGKKQLELYIDKNPFDIEARYVRALVQSEVPDFLNYNEQFDSDISYILDNIDSSLLPPEYKNTIKETINQLVKKQQL
ncbi:hypothetical protein [Carboxylicivirga sp. RSCT41]|uniref:hypothetical protein n=1 Tax=Carboxylicivirga agarovorans TaxID=3417570 RepID=UPI003D34A436